jgi:hypothetical protein
VLEVGCDDGGVATNDPPVWMSPGPYRCQLKSGGPTQSLAVTVPLKPSTQTTIAAVSHAYGRTSLVIYLARFHVTNVRGLPSADLALSYPSDANSPVLNITGFLPLVGSTHLARQYSVDPPVSYNCR